MDAYKELVRLIDEKRLEDRAFEYARWEKTKKFYREVKAHELNETKGTYESSRRYRVRVG